MLGMEASTDGGLLPPRCYLEHDSAARSVTEPCSQESLLDT